MILLLWVLAAFADDPETLDFDKAYSPREAQRPAPAPALGPEALLASRAFTLTTPYRSAWRADHPEVASGHLVALRLPASVAIVKNIGTPVLYADDRPAEVLAMRGACVVVVGPTSPVNTVLWSFGPDTPAGMVSSADGARVRTAALQGGLQPFPNTLARPDLAVADAEALWRAAEALATEVCR